MVIENAKLFSMKACETPFAIFFQLISKVLPFERRKNGYVFYNYILRSFVLKVARVIQRSTILQNSVEDIVS